MQTSAYEKLAVWRIHYRGFISMYGLWEQGRIT